MKSDLRGNDMGMDELFLSRVEEWSSEEYDERIAEAIDVYDEWKAEMSESQKVQVGKLIKEFHYYTSKRINNILAILHNEAVERFGISTKDTVISVVRKKDGKLGSSSEYWLRYKYACGMSSIFYDSLDDIQDNDWKNILKVVFVDDCSGTGETFIKFLKRQKKDLRDKLILLITIEMMKTAQIAIEDYAKKNMLNVQMINYSQQEKALSTFSELEVNSFVELSDSKNIPENYIKGFNTTEALMAFYNNTPNNTLGIFWCPTEHNTPIFRRQFPEEAGWKRCKEEKHNRREQQYNSKKVK